MNLAGTSPLPRQYGGTIRIQISEAMLGLKAHGTFFIEKSFEVVRSVSIGDITSLYMAVNSLSRTAD